MAALINLNFKKLLQAAAIAGFAASLAACGAKATADAVPPPVDHSGDGIGSGSGSSGDVQPVALTLGAETEATGDVLKDENGLFSLTRTYTLTIDKESPVQVRKTMANGNCGAPNGSFIFLQGENQVADVTIVAGKDYQGSPHEKLAAPLAAGTYTVLAMFTLDQECKNMLFFYDFVIEAAK